MTMRFGAKCCRDWCGMGGRRAGACTTPWMVGNKARPSHHSHIGGQSRATRHGHHRCHAARDAWVGNATTTSRRTQATSDNLGNNDLVAVDMYSQGP